MMKTLNMKKIKLEFDLHVIENFSCNFIKIDINGKRRLETMYYFLLKLLHILAALITSGNNSSLMYKQRASHILE